MGRRRTLHLEPQPGRRRLLADLVHHHPTLGGPPLGNDAERRREHADATRARPKAAIERALSRRDVPLREKTLWRMLYETAARANEILALDVEDLDLENQRAKIRSKGGD